MATIKTVSVVYERKFNLGDFNSAHIGCTLWADVDETDDDLHETMIGLWEMAKANVKAQAMPLKGKHEAEVKEIFMGLPVEVRAAITEEEISSNGNQRTD